MRINYFCLMIVVGFFQTLKADNDTLSTAKDYIQQGKYKKAEKLLAVFEKNHPNDLNVVWLYGQTAYWNGHTKTFKRVYDKAIIRFPSNYYLKLDYAIKLVACGDLKKAFPLMEEYYKFDKTSADLKLLFAKSEYWNEDYQAALKELEDEQVMKQKPQEAQQLKDEILSAKSFWVKAGTDYLRDDQPLQQIIPSLEAGKYYNTLVSPSISMQMPFFQTGAGVFNSLKLNVANKLNVSKIQLRTTIHAGIVVFPNKMTRLVGGIELTKTNFTYLKITAIAARQPYLSTISSIDEMLVPYHYELNFAWDDQSTWNGKLVSSCDQFTAYKNYVYNVGAWVLTPPAKISMLQFRIGYAYGYASSDENKYAAKETLAKIIAAYSPGKTIEGAYQPFFTPTNQQTHSALLNISYKPSKKIAAGANASIAFAGSMDNPYLFLDKRNSTALYVNKGYLPVNFYPYKIETFVVYKLTKKSSFKANYTFFKNNFYTSHVIGASVILNFWND